MDDDSLEIVGGRDDEPITIVGSYTAVIAVVGSYAND